MSHGTEQAPERARPRTNMLSPKKLLLTKWTAVAPVAREKHWVVVKVIAPEPPAVKVEEVVLEAVHSGRSVTLPWRALKDTGTWRQGWV